MRSNSFYKNQLWSRWKASRALLLGAQAGIGFSTAQPGTSSVSRFADLLSPAPVRCDVWVDLALVSLLLPLPFARGPSGGRTPLRRCSSILHPPQRGCTKCFTVSPTQTQTWGLVRGDVGAVLGQSLLETS